MTIFLIPFLWVLFFTNPKWMTFLVAFHFTIGHIGVFMVMDSKRSILGWLLSIIGVLGFLSCFLVWPCQRLDV